MIEPEKVGISSERLARIRPALEKHVGDDKLAGALTLIARHGKVAHLECLGYADREAKKAIHHDTIFRIFSMTKPIVCAALMMLYEQGHFQLFDPVSKFIPRFQNLKVFDGESGDGINLANLDREVTILDLLTHTSGLTYHFMEYGPVEEMYRQGSASAAKPLAEFIDDLLKLPLAFQPGTAWRYGHSHDVVGYLVEIMSNLPLDVYFQEQLFGPLGMVDTGFYVPEEKLDRFTAMYGSGDLNDPNMTVTLWYGSAMMGVNKRLAGPRDSLESAQHQVFRGGHGLVSTAADYLRFCQMMLNQGELDGIRYLGRKTVELMTSNHLAAELLPIEMGGLYMPGLGYGLGVRVVLDVAQTQLPGSLGEYGWGGGASTNFWIDPREALIGIQMAQYQPSGYHLIAQDFKVTAYQSIVD